MVAIPLDKPQIISINQDLAENNQDIVRLLPVKFRWKSVSSFEEHGNEKKHSESIAI